MRPIHVLFLCTGNSARSILAEALLDDLGGARFVARSAGSQPKGAPHPEALARLEAEGITPAGWSSKSWDVFAGPDAMAFDIVVTVCDNAAGETCPFWAGAPVTVHWGLPDPAAASKEQQPEAFKAAYDALHARISALIGLDLPAMSAQARKEALKGIHEGRT